MAINNEINIQLKAQDKASGVFKGLEWNTKKLDSKFSKLWWVIKNIWIWLGAVGAAAGVAGVKMFNLADDIETTIWKAETVFGEYFNDMDKFAKETWKAMWLSRKEFLKTASGIQDLLIPMGFTREEATKQTQELISLSGALAEWSAWQYDAAQVGDILAKAMLWEREQLKSLGISISEADVQQRLLEMGMKDLTWVQLQQAKATATQQLIFEKSTDAQKAFAEGADSLTRKKAELSATLKNTQETIATALLPAFHEIIQTLQPIIEKTAESIKLWFENEQNVRKLTDTFKTLITIFWAVFEWIWMIISWLHSLWEILGFIAFKIFELWNKIFEFNVKASESFWEFYENATEVFTWVKDWAIDTMTSMKDTVIQKFEDMLSFVKRALQKAKDTAKEIATLWFADTETFNSKSTAWSKANGWPVKGWSAYLVGERWPEMFVPSTNGSIVPSGGFSGNISINMGGVTVRNEADEDRLSRKIQDNIIEVLQQNKFWVS